ncbi:hypothetical protein AB6A40_007686 [Gnathostoma spinigerum]|uniref:Probable imidazolonepropionase n=1 Tax=Gnathostoma spinigerum TaxID=75299 RepID=A0ABD6EWM2_9BILA
MDAGLSVNFHAEELHRTGGAEMGAEIKAKAMSHLEHISRDAIKAMAQSGTVAVLLPTTAHLLRLSSPPARELIGRGVIVALGSDFNPNAYCLAMPIVMYLACINMHLSMPEALVAATINAAYSLNRGKTHGALSVGRFADIIVVGAPKWEHIIYQFGCHRSLIQKVIKKGELIHENEDRM